MHNRRFVRMVMFQVPQLPETPFHTADMLGVGVKSMNGSGGGCSARNCVSMIEVCVDLHARDVFIICISKHSSLN
jgi:hypothetical protein